MECVTHRMPLNYKFFSWHDLRFLFVICAYVGIHLCDINIENVFYHDAVEATFCAILTSLEN